MTLSRSCRTALWMIAVWVVLNPAASQACATCFGKSDSALARGMNMGIFALLGFIGMVLAGIVCVAVYFATRAARLARSQEQGQDAASANV